jgi:transposase
MDVHSTTTDLTVLNSRGKEILYRRIPTRELDLVDFFKNISGEKRAALEESQMADWVARVIDPYVSELIRCLPQHNRLISKSEKKCDQEDSRNVAELLYLNKLKSVHHPDETYRALREGVRAYWNASQQLTRAKNRLKAFFLFNGIHCEDERVYSDRYRKQYYEELEKRRANVDLARIMYLQTDSMKECKEMHLRMLRQVAKPVQDSIGRLMTIPGVGEIGACPTAPRTRGI